MVPCKRRIKHTRPLEASSGLIFITKKRRTASVLLALGGFGSLIHIYQDLTNLKRVEFKPINLSTLEALVAKSGVNEVNIDTLVAAGFVSGNDRVKILGNGTLTAALTVTAHAFSKSAEAAIVAAGGSIVKL